MPDIAIRSSIPVPSAPMIAVPDPEPNQVGAKDTPEVDIEPLDFSSSSDSDKILLEEMGIDDYVRNMAEEDQENLILSKKYVMDVIKSRNLTPTVGAFKKVFGEIRSRLGVDEFTEPSEVLERIGTLAKAWDSLGFIKDISKRKAVFHKISQIQRSKDVEKELFKEMERYGVWR